MRCKGYLPMKTYLTIYRQCSADMYIDEQAKPALSSDPESLWRRANEMVGQGRLLDAVPLYLELSDLWPERAPVWSNLGIVLSALERQAEARDAATARGGMNQGPGFHETAGFLCQSLGGLAGRHADESVVDGQGL